MPADLTKPFSESCCDGGAMASDQSCQPCGCDKGAKHLCERHLAEMRAAQAVPKVPQHLKVTYTKETRIVDEHTGGAKGMKDCQMGALDPKALWQVGLVAGFGGVKYERYNFAKGYKWSLSFDALQRHLLAFWGGENVDPESGLPHLAHAAWHCLALLTFSLRGRGTDDRFPN